MLVRVTLSKIERKNRNRLKVDPIESILRSVTYASWHMHMESCLECLSEVNRPNPRAVGKTEGEDQKRKANGQCVAGIFARTGQI